MEINQHIISSPNNSIDCRFCCNPSLSPFGIRKHQCQTICPNVCKVHKTDPFPPLLRPPPPPRQPLKQQKGISTGSITVMVCLIGASLLMTILCLVLRNQYTRQRNSRRARMAQIIFGTQEDFDFERGPDQLDHPIWYINTIGLEQSLIESITMFRYRKGEGLIDGTECSVCLSEFEEDECLRLLPKCDHAFHVHCIDTWLRSHKNCPLCRAPIVCSNFDSRVGVLAPPVLNSSSSQDSGSSSGSTSDVRNEEPLTADHLGIRVESDLVTNQREEVKVEMQPKIRRSASLDSRLSRVVSGRHRRGSSEIGLKLKNVVKRGSKRSLSFNKMMKRRSGSLESILPL